MDRSDLRTVVDQFDAALQRLREALSMDVEKEPIALDGAIQRFEFTFELCWKALKRFLADEGLSAVSPRDSLKFAFQKQWIDREETWLRMLDDRNRTSHTYRKEIALDVYRSLPEYAEAFSKMLTTLERLLAGLTKPSRNVGPKRNNR